MKPLFKSILFTVFAVTFCNSVSSQTNCDSLIVSCCDFQLIGNDTLLLTVENTATQTIFDYPGFMLLNEIGDTMAMETVNYFGIGMGQQEHAMDVLIPIDFPFTGTLQLWGNFYDTLYCEFPVNFTFVSVDELEQTKAIFPNPTTSDVHIQGVEHGNYSLYAADGRCLAEAKPFSSSKIGLGDLPEGIYFIEIQSPQLRDVFKTKIVKE